MQQLRDGSAYLASPAVGDDAEGAHQVAAVDDGHMTRDIGPDRSQRTDAPLPVNTKPLSHQFQ